jgi:hypothetical protein
MISNQFAKFLETAKDLHTFAPGTESLDEIFIRGTTIPYAVFIFDLRRHRVERVLVFFSSRLNWDPHPSVCPPFGTGAGTHLLGGRGGPNSDEGTDTVVL